MRAIWVLTSCFEKRWFRGLLSVVIACIFPASIALAGQGNSVRNESSAEVGFTIFTPCLGNSRHCAPRILVQGVITSETHAEFEKFLDKGIENGSIFTPVIVFDSIGGDLSGGLALGKLIRSRNLNTALGTSYQNQRLNDSMTIAVTEMLVHEAQCSSACIAAFIGGVEREVEEGARIGVHQFRGRWQNIGESLTQVTTVVLSAYFESMGVSRSLVDVASLVPPDAIKWLDTLEVRKYRLDNLSPPLAHWVLGARDDGTLNVSVLQPISGNRSLFLALENTPSNHIGITIMVMFNKLNYSNEEIKKYLPVGQRVIFSICNKQKCQYPTAAGNWSIHERPGFHVLYAHAVMLRDHFKQLEKTDGLKIVDGFPQSLKSFSFETELSREGFEKGVAALNKNR